MSKWISVFSELPEEGVVVAIHGGEVDSLGLKTTAGYYDSNYLCFQAILENGDLELCHATLWHSLPKPPSIK